MLYLTLVLELASVTVPPPPPAAVTVISSVPGVRMIPAPATKLLNSKSSPTFALKISDPAPTLLAVLYSPLLFTHAAPS